MNYGNYSLSNTLLLIWTTGESFHGKYLSLIQFHLLRTDLLYLQYITCLLSLKKTLEYIPPFILGRWEYIPRCKHIDYHLSYPQTFFQPPIFPDILPKRQSRVSGHFVKINWETLRFICLKSTTSTCWRLLQYKAITGQNRAKNSMQGGERGRKNKRKYRQSWSPMCGLWEKSISFL